MFPPCLVNRNQDDLNVFNSFYRTSYKFYTCNTCKSWFYFENEDDLKIMCYEGCGELKIKN